ncbi:hypothetical protein FDECE_11092 [Fusarium decemcellulare]|nr:hypothetical protein FDECE_11092 [Fusarium decemcellulare]
MYDHSPCRPDADGWNRCVCYQGRSASNESPSESLRVTALEPWGTQGDREVAEKTAAKGVRVLRDQLYPVKVDGANRTAVLDSSGNVLPGAAEVLGKKNEVTIAKMHWLSNKDNGKTYGSMVIYVTKASDARRLLGDRSYFRVQQGSTMRHRDAVQLSMMNDSDLQDYAVLAVAEPYVLNIDGTAVTAPSSHRNWIKLRPKGGAGADTLDGPYRSNYMVARLGNLVSFRNSTGKKTDVIRAGDFNRHDQLWGGDEMTGRREGEAGPIIDLMDEHGLLSSISSRGGRRRGKDSVARDGGLEAAVQERTIGRDQGESARKAGPTVPSPYAKRWWTTDLTRLRRSYTFWRNLARTRRRAGQRIDKLETRAKGAAKEYHDAIRRQKKAHWEDSLADGNNIWQAAKYLKSGDEANGDKVPPLKRVVGTTTQDKAEQAEELLNAFFPPLPADIEYEGPRPHRREVVMPSLTMEEAEGKVVDAKAWKAPGEDGLPAMVWKQLWPVVMKRVLHLFHTSLSEGRLPDQWRTIKIIPLRKPGKEDHRIAKTWRPISLLSTPGKILEAIVADRISYTIETCGLPLPTNHSGARRRRSAAQALLLSQEQVYKAWRNRKVVGLASFDVNGGLQRGVQGQTVAKTGSAAGLPQGSPLSPGLFLFFFSADLVQSKIDAKGDSIAFVEDYSTWVTGSKVEANREDIRAIIDRALAWERRSGAAFECDKTTIVHFTRVAERTSCTPSMIKGKQVKPTKEAKTLGVALDAKLRFKKHTAEAAAKGHVPEETQDAVPMHGQATLHHSCGASHGLRLCRLVARTWREGTNLAQQSSKDGSTGHHGSLSDSIASGRGSGGRYPDGRQSARSSRHEVVYQRPDVAKDALARNSQSVSESEILVTFQKTSICVRNEWNRANGTDPSLCSTTVAQPSVAGMRG